LLSSVISRTVEIVTIGPEIFMPGAILNFSTDSFVVQWRRGNDILESTPILNKPDGNILIKITSKDITSIESLASKNILRVEARSDISQYVIYGPKSGKGPYMEIKTKENNFCSIESFLKKVNIRAFNRKTGPRRQSIATTFEYDATMHSKVEELDVDTNPANDGNKRETELGMNASLKKKTEILSHRKVKKKIDNDFSGMKLSTLKSSGSTKDACRKRSRNGKSAKKKVNVKYQRSARKSKNIGTERKEFESGPRRTSKRLRNKKAMSYADPESDEDDTKVRKNNHMHLEEGKVTVQGMKTLSKSEEEIEALPLSQSTNLSNTTIKPQLGVTERQALSKTSALKNASLEEKESKGNPFVVPKRVVISDKLTPSRQLRADASVLCTTNLMSPETSGFQSSISMNPSTRQSTPTQIPLEATVEFFTPKVIQDPLKRSHTLKLFKNTEATETSSLGWQIQSIGERISEKRQNQLRIRLSTSLLQLKKEKAEFISIADKSTRKDKLNCLQEQINQSFQKLKNKFNLAEAAKQRYYQELASIKANMESQFEVFLEEQSNSDTMTGLQENYKILLSKFKKFADQLKCSFTRSKKKNDCDSSEYDRSTISKFQRFLSQLND